MDNLIKITEKDGQQIVSARELHEFLEIKKPLVDWFKYQAKKCMFVEKEDFITILCESTGGRPSTDYAITISAAKEISMINGKKKGKEARMYFIACETKLKQITTQQLPLSYLEALKELVIKEEQKQLAEAKVAELLPKAEFFDAVTGSSDCFDIGIVAKTLNVGIGRNKLFEFLRTKQVLMNNNIPYQKYCDAGFFRTIEQKYTKPDGSTHISIKTVVYQSGLNYISKLLKKTNLNDNEQRLLN